MKDKREIIYDFKINGLEDIDEFKEILKILQEYETKKLPREKTFEYIKELERLFNELKLVYPEINTQAENIKLILDRTLNDELSGKNYHDDSLRKGAKAIQKEIQFSEAANFELEDYSNRKIDIKSYKEKFNEQVQDLILSEFFDKGLGKDKSDVMSMPKDFYDLINIDFNAPDSDDRLMDAIAEKFADLNKYLKYSKEGINLLKNALNAYKETATFESALDDQKFVSFNEFVINNQKMYDEAKKSLEDYADMDEETKDRILQNLEEQINVKTQFYIKESELKKKYNIHQDFSWREQFGRGRYFENSWHEGQKYSKRGTNWKKFTRGGWNESASNMPILKIELPQSLPPTVKTLSSPKVR